jgi:hypothetical protein
MIKVTIHYLGKGLESLRVQGHAKSAEYGKDLVCAGVSACTIGALNALEDGDESYDISVEEGDVKLTCKKPIGPHDNIVLETLIIQLKTIEKSYPGYLDFKERKD